MFQHEGGRATLDDARKQMVNILKNIEEKSINIEQVKTELQKRKLESLKAQEEEQVCVLRENFYLLLCSYALVNDESDSLSF